MFIKRVLDDAEASAEFVDLLTRRLQPCDVVTNEERRHETRTERRARERREAKAAKKATKLVTA